MNLRQRYKARGRRRLKKFLLVYSFFVFILLFYSTFARYTTVVEDMPSVNIANWEIKVNSNEIVNGQTLSNVIKLVPNAMAQTTSANKLAPGQEGNFDIIINPDGTEVSLEYEIYIETINLPEGLKIKTYEIIEDDISDVINENKINGEIILNNLRQGLEETDTKTVRIYWIWEENENNSIPNGSEKYDITAAITVKQKIN